MTTANTVFAPSPSAMTVPAPVRAQDDLGIPVEMWHGDCLEMAGAFGCRIVVARPFFAPALTETCTA